MKRAEEYIARSDMALAAAEHLRREGEPESCVAYHIERARVLASIALAAATLEAGRR